MSHSEPVVVFTVDQSVVAVPVGQVQYIIRAVAITPLPDAPQSVLGYFIYHGTPVPVMDLSNVFHTQRKPVHPAQYFLIINTPSLNFAIIIDELSGYQELEIADTTVQFSGLSQKKLIRSVSCDGFESLMILDFLNFFDSHLNQQLATLLAILPESTE
ncbi:MAG: chemotaxis protein CheW [Ignavibacteria bacterium]|nr:chemotaxis protein CheW [Ignavibacteria bacterium]